MWTLGRRLERAPSHGLVMMESVDITPARHDFSVFPNNVNAVRKRGSASLLFHGG